ncbi:MAG: hypothetical protein IK128_01905 [Clostridiales bacterium]|nr:hypothetical protein [Clostridiales bacterium]
MEWILIINGITPYIYLGIVAIVAETGSESSDDVLGILAVIFAVQLLTTIILSIVSRDKAKLAKVTMINKFIQIPYYIIFFIIAVLGVLIFMGLMGVGLLFIPVFIAIDIGVFLTTVIPEEICTIKLIMSKKIPVWKFILYLIGNCIYCVDIVLAVLVHKDFKKAAAPAVEAPADPL